MADRERDFSQTERSPVILAPETIARTYQRSPDPDGTVPFKQPSSREGLAGSQPAPSMPLPSIPAHPDDPPRFTVVRELGRGGMGRVDEVFDNVLGRAVAQKSVLAWAGLAETTLLVSEAQTCAQLEHPSIVPIYDFGAAPDSGLPQYTMRLVRGRTLREVLDAPPREGPLSKLTQRLGVFRQVCLAVAYAHERGVVHRDVKPENIICGEFGEVYVLDWGIAHLVEGSDVRRTETEEVVAGSPAYMAPEQIAAGTIVPASDVFSLGAILFEILVGERAFIAAPKSGMLRAPSAPLAQLLATPDSFGAFDALMAECLQEDANVRPTAREIADAIDTYLDGERSQVERERDAELFARQGDEAFAAFEERSSRARAMREEARRAIHAIPVWESADEKEQAWDLAAEADNVAEAAARDLARAEEAYSQALGRSPLHPRGRRGLANLHYRSFTFAEDDGDLRSAAKYLALARAYDDGDLRLELANEGALVVETSARASISVARYVRRGLRLVRHEERLLEPGKETMLQAGSYLVVIRPDDDVGREVRYPIRIRRAHHHRARVRIPKRGQVPDGMILVPGGPFLAANTLDTSRLEEHTLPDFAIGRFPVTLREYVAFLETLPPDEVSTMLTTMGEIERDPTRGWRVSQSAVEGPARARLSASRELELPATMVSWIDARRFAAWRAATSGLALRLPTELEWEKAMRGADGRKFSMGDHLNASFAKLRESRPEYAQPEPIGAFPLDASPYGVRDLTGGVGDWTATMADGEALPDDVAAATTERQAVWRGGSWSTTSFFPHAMRFTSPLAGRTGWIGFRLCLPLDGDGSSELTVEPMRKV